jgi:hypothetical protein
VFYKLHILRQKSWDKHNKAIEWYIDILKKEMKSGESKWTINTKKRAVERLKKYWIKSAEVVKFLERKGLNDLVSKVSL